jgi:hypothetical protein
MGQVSDTEWRFKDNFLEAGKLSRKLKGGGVCLKNARLEW